MLVRYVGKSDSVGCINGKIYEVIAEEKNFYRIIDESGEDYLYLKKNLTNADSRPHEEPKLLYG